MSAAAAPPPTSSSAALAAVIGGSARNVRTDSVSSVHSNTGGSTSALYGSTTTPGAEADKYASSSSASSSPYDRTAGAQAAIFRSSNISIDSSRQPEGSDTTASDASRSPSYAHHERINPFDKNKPTTAAASPPSAVDSSTTNASISAGRQSSYDRSSGAATTTAAAAVTSVIQKQPSTTRTTTTTGSVDSTTADYTAPKYTATKSYARTDSAYRRDFRSNSISAHSEYSHNKPTSGISGSPLYSTLEEQPKPRPAAAPVAVTPPIKAPVSTTQSSRSDAYTTSKFTRSIGSFSDAELIFGSPAAGGTASTSAIGGAASDRFSSSTDSGAVFRSSGGSMSQSSQDTPERRVGQQPAAYKIYDGIQNHAFQDYDSGPGSLKASREEDDEYDLK